MTSSAGGPMAVQMEIDKAIALAERKKPPMSEKDKQVVDDIAMGRHPTTKKKD